MPKQRDNDSVHGGADVADVGDVAADSAGVGGGDQPSDGSAIVYLDLVSLIRGHGAQLQKNERVYEVEPSPGDKWYVVTNSPGSAALAVCDVRRVSDKEVVKAAFEAMGARVG